MVSLSMVNHHQSDHRFRNDELPVRMESDFLERMREKCS